MRLRVLIIFIVLVSLHSSGVCQDQMNGCNEKAGSPQKLFVFIGELLHAKKLPAREYVNEARFSATYRIIDRICGCYTGDTIVFNVIQVFYDSSFMKHKYQLLMLTKDTAQNEDYVLWADLYFDVFRAANGQWIGAYMPKYRTTSATPKKLQPRKMHFSKDAFYNTGGMTREEIDIAYPEAYYRIKKDKAFPLMGINIDEIFQHLKDGLLDRAGMYDRPSLEAVEDVNLENVQMERVEVQNPDSVKQANEDAYSAIKDALLEDPFNEATIWLLIGNCRARDDYSRCDEFFDNLIPNYPDSAKAYLLEAKFRHLNISLEDSSRISLLQSAVKVDSTNYEASYELALSYYRLFRLQPGTYYAFASRKAFLRCATIDSAERALLKYPIIQLSNYLNDSNTVSIYKDARYKVNADAQGAPVANKYNWYFPVHSFMKNRSSFTIDYDIDIIQQLRSAKSRLNWFSRELSWFKEPMLSMGYKNNVYRFLWVRSFDETVVIRMERDNRKVNLYWKMPEARDSPDTVPQVVEFKKKLTLCQWRRFEKSLKTIDYWSMISGDYLSDQTDGAVWLLEAAINGNYKVTQRSGYIYPKYTKCLMYLLKLTDLNVPEDRIY